MIKAALMNIFILTMDQMRTVCVMWKGLFIVISLQRAAIPNNTTQPYPDRYIYILLICNTKYVLEGKYVVYLVFYMNIMLLSNVFTKSQSVATELISKMFCMYFISL